ncbi:MAG: GNAT family N-acetyltransferase [Casimicrobiaceae bacterium]
MSSDRHPVALLHAGQLILRPWRDTDRAPFAAMNADPRVMEHFPATLSAEQSDAFAERCISAIDERGWGLWAAEIGGGAPFIGFIGLAIAGPDLPCSGAIEVGWRLAAAHWGKGYASEGAQAALRYAFDELEVPEIVSFTAIGNRRSQAVMERLGMDRDPEGFEHPRVPEGNPVRPHVLYRLSRAAWRAMRDQRLA